MLSEAKKGGFSVDTAKIDGFAHRKFGIEGLFLQILPPRLFFCGVSLYNMMVTVPGPKVRSASEPYAEVVYLKKFEINEGKPLVREVSISGAKNAASASSAKRTCSSTTAA